ncbi:siderophore ABC transporter substrate-binding protein [Virgibacillus sp. W0430]|uniref:siderophore ABC transporter substrate-binding protein n=1 Tax=Virgibacillus sp. W0430 TaxID=3391580 RepID=UPI003F4552ED
MKKWSLFILLFAFIVVVSACGSNGDANEEDTASGSEESIATEDTSVTVKHELDDEEVVLEKTPEKVVVFDFGVLDTLDELGIEVTGVPQAVIPPFLEKYASEEYTNVGSLKEPDFEAIHKLDPDVIIISSRQADLYEEFKDIAPTVYLQVDYNNYMESFTENMNTVAKIFNKEEEMEKELEEVTKTIESIKEKTTSSDEKTLVIMGNEGKVSAYGPSSRFGIIHDVFGFKAADEGIEKSTHGQSITFEYIKQTNPDILFVIDRDKAFDPNASVKESIENDVVKMTNAYNNDHIYYLDGGPWYLSGGGLQTIKMMAEDVKAGVQ